MYIYIYRERERSIYLSSSEESRTRLDCQNSGLLRQGVELLVGE